VQPGEGPAGTLDLTRIVDLGTCRATPLRPPPEDAAVKQLGQFCRDNGIREVFLVAGDAPQPVGDYDGVVAFLRDFLDTDHGLTRIGITAYPDGHALIDSQVVHDALHAKQALLQQAGIAGFASTQMCFDLAPGSTGPPSARPTLPAALGCRASSTTSCSPWACGWASATACAS
jgi:methylenetetrahydrofolate reductase (NADPH)